MILYLDAGILSAFVVLLVCPCSTWLEGASWVTRCPRAAVALWHCIGISATLATIGAGLWRRHRALSRRLRGRRGRTRRTEVVGGHPLQGLGLPDALGLTLAAGRRRGARSAWSVLSSCEPSWPERATAVCSICLATPFSGPYWDPDARSPFSRRLLPAGHPSPHRHQLGHDATPRIRRSWPPSSSTNVDMPTSAMGW